MFCIRILDDEKAKCGYDFYTNMGRYYCFLKVKLEKKSKEKLLLKKYCSNNDQFKETHKLITFHHFREI